MSEKNDALVAKGDPITIDAVKTTFVQQYRNMAAITLFLVLERVLFIIIFLITFRNENTVKARTLPVNAWVRIIILDVVVSSGFIVFAIVMAKKSVVNGFAKVSLVVYAFSLLMVISTVLHLVFTFTEKDVGAFRIMTACSFALTEAFNTFLVLLYRHTGATLISTSS
eukprot:TRINITY_DN3405_c0_g2_i8.p2 TRINITY_DN3405_c0_g2~~TRINITY_DN3405_c0_g2_i8.p2  ORF type:complete len:168 (+),score=44.57 TRINITY_DN3405_c0_g2_i8:155-658(+)